LGRYRTPGEQSGSGTATDNPGPDQYSPLDRPTPTQGKKKKNWIIINNNKKTCSREGGVPWVLKGGRGNPSQNCK
jgi:hypothetical protein